jgi:hypothetical protein
MTGLVVPAGDGWRFVNFLVICYSHQPKIRCIITEEPITQELSIKYQTYEK